MTGATSPMRWAATLVMLCCSAFGALADEDPADQVLLTIDGTPITTLHLALFANQTNRNPQDGDAQLRLLNELANHFLIAESPQGEALATRADVAAAITVARARLLAEAFVAEALLNAQIDEQQIVARYDETYGAGAPRQEYKARHILLKDRDEALATIDALDSGSDFATLARERSIGPSKTVGGDLGWFEADQMVPAFSAAVADLADGAYTKQPIETQFGWHVILREGSRSVPVPTLADVRAEIEALLRQEEVANKVKAMRDAADIQIQDVISEN